MVERLASDLQAEFPGIIGFSWRNLFTMSEFFTAYRESPKLQPLAAIIGWTQNIHTELADLEFPRVGGFSASNLWRMKGFFETYAPSENSHHWCEKSAGLRTFKPSWPT